MLEYLIALVPSLFAPVDDMPYTDTPGRCAYPEAVAELDEATVLIECSLLRTSRDGPVTYDFRHRGFGPGIRISGDLQGDTLVIHTITFRNGEVRSARGQCQTFYAKGEVSAVTCLASTKSQHFAVNFVPSPF